MSRMPKTEALSGAVAQAAHLGSEALSEVSDQATGLAQRLFGSQRMVESWVRKNPFSSAAIAMGVGVLLGMACPHMSRRHDRDEED